MTVPAKPADYELPPRRRPQVGAFFDLDKTLIAENSGALYMKYRVERGEVSAVEVAKGLWAYMQYKAGVLDLTSWARGEMAQFKGQSEADLLAQARAEFAPRVRAVLYPEAVEIVQQHQKAGHIVAIVSGATRFVIEPLAEYLGIEHLLYTRLEVEDGLFTGRVIEPICFEEGKIYWLEQFIQEHDIDLARSYFYTDSVTDVPLLELVGHPEVVNPDPFLYRVATQRCWPVQVFTAPGEKPARESERDLRILESVRRRRARELAPRIGSGRR